MERAVFIDRDGPILIDKGYMGDPGLAELAPGAAEGIKLLRQAGYKVIIISNQSGVGRGMFELAEAKTVHNRMVQMLKEQGTEINDSYYCFHAPNEGCKCRKPKPTLIYEAAEKHHIDLGSSFMAGDKASDILTGKNADHGMRAILVGQKEGEPLTPEDRKLANYECANLLEAAEWVGNRAQGIGIGA